MSGTWAYVQTGDYKSGLGRLGGRVSVWLIPAVKISAPRSDMIPSPRSTPSSPPPPPLHPIPARTTLILLPDTEPEIVTEMQAEAQAEVDGKPQTSKQPASRARNPSENALWPSSLNPKPPLGEYGTTRLLPLQEEGAGGPGVKSWRGRRIELGIGSSAVAVVVVGVGVHGEQGGMGGLELGGAGRSRFKVRSGRGEYATVRLWLGGSCSSICHHLYCGERCAAPLAGLQLIITNGHPEYGLRPLRFSEQPTSRTVDSGQP